MLKKEKLMLKKEKLIVSMISYIFMLIGCFAGYVYGLRGTKLYVIVVFLILGGIIYRKILNGVYFNHMKKLEEGIQTSTKQGENIRRICNTVYNKSCNIDRNAQSLNDQNIEFKQNLDDISRVIDDIALSSIKQSDDIDKFTQILNKLGEKVLGVNELVKKIYKDIENINDNKNNGEILMQNLNEFSDITLKAILDIIDVIEEINDNVENIAGASEGIQQIASRTNLLALNASIEAARVGDVGGGFSVIAEEIRELSDQSGDFAKKIEDDLDLLIESSRKSLEHTGKIRQVIGEQMDKILSVEDNLREIGESIKTALDSVDEVREVEGVIQDGLGEVMVYIENLYGISHENSAYTQELNSNVQNQLEYLDGIVEASKEILELSHNIKDISMESKMLVDINILVDYVEEYGYSNENLIDICDKLNIDTAYIADNTGYVHYCNEPIGRGVNLFEFDSSLKDLLKGEEYVVTPIKLRVEDKKVYKFLAIYRNDLVYEIGIDLT